MDWKMTDKNRIPKNAEIRRIGTLKNAEIKRNRKPEIKRTETPKNANITEWEYQRRPMLKRFGH